MQKNKLETIYEVDEDPISEEDSSKSANHQSQLSVYMCWCMITGCFLILTFIIIISLNPQYLLNNSSQKHTRNIRNVPFHSEDKVELSTEIISYLSIFSPEINKQLDLQSNPIIFITTPILNSSLDVANQSGILWIYGHVKYPRLCINNVRCKENFHSKLKIAFTELSKFINSTQITSYHSRQIQFDWCNLLENTTTATFISLVSIKTVIHNTTETIASLDSLICGNLDQNVFSTTTIDDLISQENVAVINLDSIFPDDEKLTPTIDSINNSMESGGIPCISQLQHGKYNNDNTNHHIETTHCPNDTGSQYLLMWNSF